MATAQMQRAKQKTGKWSTVFPSEQVTDQQSGLFVKKLLAVAISNITYLRTIFPEYAYGDRCLEDLNLKILRDDSSCPGACQVIQWIKACFDALDKKYLRMIVMALYKNSDSPNTVIESYTFKFFYDVDGISIYRNEERITGASSAIETRRATINLLRTIVVLTQTLKPLPDDVMMSMKLLYYDEVTPKDYEPPGFQASCDEDFAFNGDPMNIKVGDVQTPFHEVRLRVATECQQFVVREEEEKMNESNIGLNDVELQPCGKAIEPKQQAQESPPPPPPSAVECDELNDSEVTSTTCHIEDGDNPVVRCPCGYNEDDGLMILCSVCDEWQHGSCFGMIDEPCVPETHICELCAEKTSKPCTDPELPKLNTLALQAHCLWRRSLTTLMDMNRVLPHTLAKKMNVDVTVAQGLVNRLVKEGYVKAPPKGRGGKSHYKLIQKDLIKEKGFGMYFILKSTDEQSNKEKPEVPIHSSINTLTQKTSSMTIESCDQQPVQDTMNVKPGAVENMLTNELNATVVERRSEPCLANRSIKRAWDETNSVEFEISESQEPNYGNEGGRKRKRRKASITTRAIIV